MIARIQLAAYVMGQPNRLRLDGPAIVLPAPRAGPFNPVLHELATNAAKHGAWSEAEGTGEAERRWRGNRRAAALAPVDPQVAAMTAVFHLPAQIRRSLPGATVSHDFEPDGVVCTITLPLTDVGAEAD